MRGVLGDLRARAHRDADVGGLDRRGVVDAVAGHGHDVALLAQGLHHQHLVLGCHPADDADLVDAGQPLFLGEGCEVRAEDRLSGDAELPGDRLACDDVVAGHHPHADVGVLGVADGVLGLGSGRIDHSDHRRHLQVRDQRQQVAVGVEVRGVDVPGGRDHDAQPLAAEALHLLGGSGVLLVTPGNGLTVGQGGRRHARSPPVRLP